MFIVNVNENGEVYVLGELVLIVEFKCFFGEWFVESEDNLEV